MAERPTKEIKKKQLAKEVTNELISSKVTKTNNVIDNKYRKLIVWDISMKQILDREAIKRNMTSTGFIKYCVTKEIGDLD